MALSRGWGQRVLEGDWKDGPCPPVIKLPTGTPEGSLEGCVY